MKLKINRWTFYITNNDLVLDNSFCYQCITLKHYSPSASWAHFQKTTIMSKNQFNKLVKEGKLIDYSEEFFKKHPHIFDGCKIWKFNIEDKDNETHND